VLQLGGVGFAQRHLLSMKEGQTDRKVGSETLSWQVKVHNAHFLRYQEVLIPARRVDKYCFRENSY